MRIRRFALALFALVLSTGLHHVSAQGRGVPGNVVFFSARDGNNEIYVMNWDGSRPFRVTDNPASDIDPALSPNGRDIVFTSDRTGNSDIYIVGSAGGAAVNLTNNPGNDGWARWSPDGRQIVFHGNRDGNFEIYAMNADGSSLTRLTNYPGVDQFPDWSPNGRSIVFRRDTDHRHPGSDKRPDPAAHRRAAAQSDGGVVAERTGAGLHEHTRRYPSVFLHEHGRQPARSTSHPRTRVTRTATGSAGRHRGQRRECRSSSCLLVRPRASIATFSS